ncbi:hypothetical protein [Actinoplanes sp. TFC3]|nr:hypothetical protein [Actinoplanes sp. TFC3]
MPDGIVESCAVLLYGVLVIWLARRRGLQTQQRASSRTARHAALA